jgi:predicted glycoside hydrolase/deacetylase ChbG (UPF0249 family)
MSQGGASHEHHHQCGRFGYDADTVAATAVCLDDGSLTSATIMPRMPGTEAALEAARRMPHRSFGVHLTFVCDTVEAPLSPPESIPALVAADGRFLPSQVVRKLAMLRRLPVDQIKREAAAQIDAIRSAGIPVSHVDSHGHLHKFAPFQAALVDVLRERGIRKVRNVQDVYLKRPLKSPTFWLGPIWRRSLMRSFVSTDHFYMCTSAGDSNWPERLVDVIQARASASWEVGVHPGFAEAWRRSEHDAIQAFAALARARGHRLIGWNAL